MTVLSLYHMPGTSEPMSPTQSPWTWVPLPPPVHEAKRSTDLTAAAHTAHTFPSAASSTGPGLQPVVP